MSLFPLNFIVFINYFFHVMFIFLLLLILESSARAIFAMYFKYSNTTEALN